MRKFKAYAVLVLALLCAVSLLAGCGSQETADATKAPALSGNQAEYRVSIVNAKGQPYTSGIIACFYQNGTQVSMQVADENGIAAKVLDRGEYTVELMYTDANASYVCQTTDLTLTADKTELEITLAHTLGSEFMEIQYDAQTLTGYYVDVCCTQVPLTAGQRTYYLFTPTEAGVYEISAIGEVSGIGCYGTPYFVQENSIYEVVDNSFTVTIRSENIGSSGSAVLVIGIDSDSADSCILSVDRIGDPEWRPEDDPYVVYQPGAKLTPYTLPAGASLREFDLTADTDAYTLVYNDQDGFYHLDSAEGPLVLVKLGEDNKYMSCYKTIMEKTGVRKYFYDENGEYLRREDYYDCLAQYIGKVDVNGNEMYPGVMDKEAGVYPLTEDLKYIIQNHGGYNGWWDLDSETSIFQDDNGDPIPGINEELAWLFMCVYIAQ